MYPLRQEMSNHTSDDAKQRFDSIESAVEAFGMLPLCSRLLMLSRSTTTYSLKCPDPFITAAGDFVIVLDSTSRENEGDLIIAASALTPTKAAFMIHHSSGYLCAPMPASRADALDLPPMIPFSENADPNRTAYTITVDADVEGITTGISAHDRSLTCNLLADPKTRKQQLRRPGHVVPLRAVDGGVRARQGHTEAAVELCKLAKLEPVGVIAEIVEEGETIAGAAEMTGTAMMRRDGCMKFGATYGIKVITIEDLVAYVGKHAIPKA